ncbi:MAG: PorT family protein [Muribaculaceae bacterium]|nr:PorT family protein [Muribaculaceae bacterium]
MKNLRLLLLCLAACCFLMGSAETHYRPHISIGGRAGLSMASMSFSPSVKQTWNMGTAGAVTFRYTEEKLFGVIAELGWVQCGWKEKYEDLPFSYSRQTTYLTLPVLTHIYFGSRRFKTFVNLGPSVSLLLGNTISANFDYRNPQTVPDYPRNRQTEHLWADITGKFDYGICAGLGFEFYMAPRHSAVVEARFYYGLGNIFPSSKADTFGASRNMNLEITLGYNFRLK